MSWPACWKCRRSWWHIECPPDTVRPPLGRHNPAVPHWKLPARESTPAATHRNTFTVHPHLIFYWDTIWIPQKTIWFNQEWKVNETSAKWHLEHGPDMLQVCSTEEGGLSMANCLHQSLCRLGHLLHLHVVQQATLLLTRYTWREKDIHVCNVFMFFSKQRCWAWRKPQW